MIYNKKIILFIIINHHPHSSSLLLLLNELSIKLNYLFQFKTSETNDI